MPELSGIEGSGVTVFEISDFSGSGLKIALSGASGATGFFGYDLIDADLSGASRLNLQGSASVLDASLSGASKLQAGTFPAQGAVVKASGASTAAVNASSTLSCDLSGNSRLEYCGSPSITFRRTSGGSSIARLPE